MDRDGGGYDGHTRERRRDDDYHYRSHRSGGGSGHRERSSRDRSRDRDRDHRRRDNHHRDQRDHRDHNRDDDYQQRSSQRSSHSHRSRHQQRSHSRSRSASHEPSTQNNHSSSSRRDSRRSSRRGDDSPGTPSSSSTAALTSSRSRTQRFSRSPSPGSANPCAPPLPPNISGYVSEQQPTSSSSTHRSHNPQQRYYAEPPQTDLVDADDVVVDTEQIHREMQDRLIRHLAREGKVYPPARPQAQHPIFANDGSFLETFKRLQETPGDAATVSAASSHPSASSSSTAAAGVPKQTAPMFGKRRGGKILKTGIVAKQKVAEEEDPADGKTDAWSLYLQEVKKYKSVSCDSDAKTRPLVK